MANSLRPVAKKVQRLFFAVVLLAIANAPLNAQTFYYGTGSASSPGNATVAGLTYGTGAAVNDGIMTGTTIPAGTYYFRNLTINSATLTVSGVSAPLVIYCTGTCTINGTLSANGSTGGSTASSVAGTAGTAGWGGNGGNGAAAATNAVAGTAGSIFATATNSAGTATSTGTTSAYGGGGGGGVYTATNATAGTAGTGGGGSAGAAGTTAYGGTTDATGFPTTNMIASSITTNLLGGAGGAGGGSSSGSAANRRGGGAGGNGGGAIQISAQTLTFGASGIISANGGNGGNGDLNSSRSGGGGGGGSGGTILLQYIPGGSSNYTSANATANGGTGGSGGGVGNGTGGHGGNGRIYTMTDGAPCGSVSGLTQASGLTATYVSNTSATLNWTRGNGDQVIVLAHAGALVNYNPTSGVDYTAGSGANLAFGSGNQIGIGNYVVYIGTGTSATVTNLNIGTTNYYFTVYEMKSTGNCYDYASPPTAGISMSYVSSLTAGNATPVTPGTTNQQVIGLQIVTAGYVSPILLNSITFSLNGSTAAADISKARIWYTGTSSTFATTTQFGTDVVGPALSTPYTITPGTGTTLANGNNYFWIAYDIASVPTSTLGDLVHADCTNFNITAAAGTSNKAPSPANPSGSRTIGVSYCAFAPGGSYGPCVSAVCSFLDIGVDVSNTNNLYSGSGCNSNAYTNVGTSYLVNTNTSYPLNITMYDISGYLGNYPATIVAYADWTYSGTLSSVSTGTATNNNPVMTNIAVPSNAIYGSHLLRVVFGQALFGSLTMAPCGTSGTFTGGQAMDFILNVQPAGTNMFYSSSTTTQTGTSAQPNSTNQLVVGLQVVTVGTLNPISATSITFNTTGTGNTSTDISNARIWYTGSSSTFATSGAGVSQFGSTLASPGAGGSITGSATLSPGTNYFWLTYDIPSGATYGHFASAAITSVTVNSVGETPGNISTGNLLISPAYCTISPAFGFASNGAAGNVYITTAKLSGVPFYSNGGVGANPYTDLTNNAANVTAGQSYTLNLVSSASTSSFSTSYEAWVDWNNDGSFTDNGSDNIMPLINVNKGGTLNVTSSSFTIPSGASGNYRMRIEVAGGGNNNSGNPSAMSPCNSGNYDNQSDGASDYAGEIKDFTLIVTPNSGCSGTPPTAGVSASPATICGAAATTTLSLTGLGTTTGYTYQWFSNTSLSNSGGSSIGSATGATYTTPVLSATAYYYCVVTCSNGSASAASNPIQITYAPNNLTAGIDNANPCNGTTVHLTASGTTSYSWSSSPSGFSSSSATPTANPTATTIYTVAGTINGCTFNKSVTANVISVAVSPASTTIATGGNTSLTATPANNYGSVTYGWNTCSTLSAATGSSVTASPTGSTVYTVSAFDANGCTASGTATVNVLDPGIPPVVGSGPTSIASGYTYTNIGSGGNNWADVSSLGTPVLNVNPFVANANYTSQSIGFNFSYISNSYSTIGVNSNGFVWFGTGAPAATNTTPLSSTSGQTGTVNGIISAFGASFLGGTGTLRTITTGVAPGRVFIIEWKGVQVTGSSWDQASNPLAGYGNNALGDYQIRLYETTNVVELWYQIYPYWSSDVDAYSVWHGQVGLMGASTADFQNVSLPGCTGDWASPSLNVSNSSVAYVYIQPTSTSQTITGSYDCISKIGFPPNEKASGGQQYRYAPSGCTPVQTSITAGGATDLCPGGSVTLTAASASSYQWYLNGAAIPTATSQSYTASAAGNYAVVPVAASGCGKSSYVTTVTTNSNVTPSVVIVSNPMPLCNATSATYTATPTNGGCVPTYQWQLNGTPVTGIPLNSTTYTNNALNANDQVKAIMTSDALCTSSSTATSNIVTNGITPSITPGSNPTVCLTTTSASLNYSNATNSPNQYSIAWGSTATTAGFTNVNNASLPTSPITIAVPGTAAANTYTGTLTVAVNSTGCTSSNYSISVTSQSCSSTSTWIGPANGDWNTGTNWSPIGVPNSCAATVIITSGSPVISASDINVGDITLGDGATLTLTGHNLTVCGNWTGGTSTNSAVVGTGTAILSGSGAQTLNGNTQFNILRINNTNGVSLASRANVSISTGLQLNTGQLNVSAGTLTLLSTASNNSSYIDDFTGGFTPGTISGNIIAQRYVPVAGSNQHFISSPLGSVGLSQVGATGTDGAYIIPTNNCDETISDGSSPYGSVFTYVDGHQPSGACMLGNWRITTAGNMLPAQGYSTYLSGNSTLSVTGSANTGGMQISTFNSAYPAVSTLQQTADGGNGAIESGWALIGNPYPSALDLTVDRTAAGFDAQVQVWKTSGPFAGTWQATTITGENGAVVIPPFQAFMVHVTTGKARGNYTYHFYQSERTRTTNLPFYRTPSQNTLQLTLNYNGMQDITAVSFNPSATNSFDAAYDANKQDGSAGHPTLYTFFPNATTWYAINTVPSLTQTATIPMGLRPNNNGSMTINAQGIETFDPTTYILLEDKQTGTWQNMRDGAYTFNTTPTDNQQRFVLHFSPPAQITTSDASCNMDGLISIEQPGTVNWNYAITDANDNILSAGSLSQSNPVNVSVPLGVYQLTLTDNDGYTVVKSIRVSGFQQVMASFTTNTTTTQVQQPIQFSNTSNSNMCSWNFGDGASATGTTVLHSYQNEGVYTVTLSVTNADGCTSFSTQTITVTSTSTGISNLNGNNNIPIWSSDNRVFVDFTNQSDVDAQIDLYNVLGQLLSSEKFGRSSIYSRPIDNMEAAYIIVRVVNGEAIETKKVLITNVH